MAILTLRSTKGSPLTNTELDNNFSNIAADIGVLSNLSTTSNSNIVAAVNATLVNVGNLSLLTTSNTSNLVVAINEAASTGGSGLEPWVSKITTYTAVTGDRLLANTANAAFTVTLPASPVVGDEITVADGYNFGTNALTIGRNGKKISGLTSDYVIQQQGAEIQLVYDGVSNWKVFSLVQTKESLGLGTANSVTFTAVTSNAYKDSTGNTLLIKDESGTVIWGN